MARSSDKQEKILQFITQYTKEKGFPPTVREIGEAVGLKSPSSVQYQLDRLRAEGRIPRAEGNRTAVVPGTRMGQVPILGVVTAGAPILAQENVQGYLPWDGEDGCFALEVRGDSMINAGILHGDVVVVRPQSAADHGDIVVALLEDEATVKRLYRKDGETMLLPENPAYEPIRSEHIGILGKVRAVVRIY